MDTCSVSHWINVGLFSAQDCQCVSWLSPVEVGGVFREGWGRVLGFAVYRGEVHSRLAIKR